MKMDGGEVIANVEAFADDGGGDHETDAVGDALVFYETAIGLALFLIGVDEAIWSFV